MGAAPRGLEPSSGTGTKTPCDPTWLRIVGLGTQWPDRLVTADEFETRVKRWFDPTDPIIQKLLRVNKVSGISTRAHVTPDDPEDLNGPTPPSITTVDNIFRAQGTQLAVRACRTALSECSLHATDLTHTVAVTTTNAGCPGFDTLVNATLGVADTCQRTLLHGVGCAGGLSALRAAAEIATAQAARHRPARVLVYACEITSTFLRAEVGVAVSSGTFSVAPVLFGDGAAALVLVNSVAAREDGRKYNELYAVREWAMQTVADTVGEMAYRVCEQGFLAKIPRDTPSLIEKSMHALFSRICSSAGRPAQADGFQWALHPGGAKIITGVREMFDLTDELLQSTWDVYRRRGNVSSVTVLAVLDDMRRREAKSKDVLACSVGPGLMLEMAVLELLHGEHR